MAGKNDLSIRKNIRLTGYDYSNSASYFITICTQPRRNYFWKNTHAYELSEIGRIVNQYIQSIPAHYDLISVDKYVVMPDHVHLLFTVYYPTLNEDKKSPNVLHIVKQFKGMVTKAVGKNIWQKSCYDHVIRNDQDYDEVWNYIENNPYKFLNTLNMQ